MGLIVAEGTFKERMETSCLIHNFKPLAGKFVLQAAKRCQPLKQRFIQQPMRTKPSIIKVRDISRNERSFNFYLESVFGVVGYKTALLEKNGNIILIFQAIPKWKPDDHREDP